MSTATPSAKVALPLSHPIAAALPSLAKLVSPTASRLTTSHTMTGLPRAVTAAPTWFLTFALMDLPPDLHRPALPLHLRPRLLLRLPLPLSGSATPSSSHMVPATLHRLTPPVARLLPLARTKPPNTSPVTLTTATLKRSRWTSLLLI